MPNETTAILTRHNNSPFTQEPTSPKFSDADTVHTKGCWDGTQKRDIVTQEPVFLKSFVDANTQIEFATILVT